MEETYWSVAVFIAGMFTGVVGLLFFALTDVWLERRRDRRK